MPKKSLVINGFLGGINEDGDLSDLESEDRQGRNHLKSCTDALCNQPGKIRAKRPTVVAHDSDLEAGDGDPAGIAGSGADFLIHGSKYYREDGIYKFGEDIEYSSKNELRRPPVETLGSKTVPAGITPSAIGLDAFGTEEATDVDYLFQGKMSQNATGDAKIANKGTIKGESVGTNNASSNDYMRFAMDTSAASGSSAIASTDVFNISPLGSYYKGHTVGLWDEDDNTTDHGAGYAEDAVENADGGLIEHLGSSANANDKTYDASIVNADYIRFGLNADGTGGIGGADLHNATGVCFRTGTTRVDSSTDKPRGMYTDDLNITDKDIVIELQLNAYTSTSSGADGAGSWHTAFSKMYVIADCQQDDRKVYFNADKYTKQWTVTKDALQGYGCEVLEGDDALTSGIEGGARFTIPWDSAISTGELFSSSSVVAFWIVFDMSQDAVYPDHTWPRTIWHARIFEVSFRPSTTIGWAQTETVFSQSKVITSATGNKIESLPQQYSGLLEMKNERTLGLSMYEPNEDNYTGNVYYQEADANGNGVGSMFLMAEVSKAKGVKTVLAGFYNPWLTINSGAECKVTNASDEIFHDGETDIRIGMRVTKESGESANFTIADDTYVAEIVSTTPGVETASFKIQSGSNMTVVSGPLSNVTLTFSGRVTFNVPNPPVSSTYQLSAGYSQDTETINAKWDHAAVVGRQIYIGSVIKTGDDLYMDLVNAATVGLLPENYPLIDTIGLTVDEGKVYRIKILESGSTPGNESTFEYSSNDGGSYTGDIDIGNQTYVVVVEGIKIKFPQGDGYTAGDEWKYETKKETDLILKSAIGRRYGFPNLQYVDLELGGTGITAMYSVGDRLFVFTSSSLILVNVAQDYEFLEGTFQGHGIDSAKQVVEVNEGLAYVNNSGVYYFDGNKMESLSDDLMMTFDTNWSTASNIGYLPQEKLICVWHSTDDVICYSLATKAWVSNSLINAAPTTRVKFYNNIAYWLDSGTLKKLALTNTTTNTVVIETGRIACGDLSRKKKFQKVHVTTVASVKFKLQYKIDSGSYAPVSPEALAIDGLNSVDIGATGKTIQFKITSDASLESGAEISDIVIIYRDLRIT